MLQNCTLGRDNCDKAPPLLGVVWISGENELRLQRALLVTYQADSLFPLNIDHLPHTLVALVRIAGIQRGRIERVHLGIVPRKS